MESSAARTKPKCCVKVVRDRAYGEHYKQQLDIYFPAADDNDADSAFPVRGGCDNQGVISDGDLHPLTANRGLPTILFVHGGGWKRFGRRAGMGMHGNIGAAFAARGYVVGVISYRLSSVHPVDLFFLYTCYSALIGGLTLAYTSIASAGGQGAVAAAFILPYVLGYAYNFARIFREGASACGQVRHPCHVQDAAASCKWMVDNVARYGGDPHNIAVMGHSAGGHIASMLAVQPKWLVEAGLAQPWENVKAFVLLSGVYNPHKLELRHVLGEPPTLASNSDSDSEKISGSGTSMPPPPYLPRRGHTKAAPSQIGLIDADAIIVDKRESPLSRQVMGPLWLCFALIWWALKFVALWPVMQFRRIWFIYPAFGRDRSNWSGSFATGHCADPHAVAAMRLPPLLLVNASGNDLGLELHTDELEAQLQAAQRVVAAAGAAAGGDGGRGYHMIVQRMNFKGNHMSYVYGMGRPGCIGEDVAVPQIASFLALAGVGGPAVAACAADKRPAYSSASTLGGAAAIDASCAANDGHGARWHGTAA